MTYSYAFAIAIASYETFMSSRKGENSRGYRSQGRRIAEESSISTEADPSGGRLSLESPTPQHPQRQQRPFAGYIPIDLQEGFQPSQLTYGTVVPGQPERQPQSNPYGGPHQLPGSLLSFESIPSEPNPADDSTDVARQSQVFSAGHPSDLDLLPPSGAYYSEPMYASIQAYYPPSEPSLPSHHLAGNIEGSLTPSQPFLSSETTMLPHNRQSGSFPSHQGQWTQYGRSGARADTPEQPSQRRPEESLPPFSAPAAYPSSHTAMFPNAAYPLGVQQAANQPFYPTSAPYPFNQPNYEFPQPSFVPSSPYPITTSPESRIHMAPSPFVPPSSTASTPEPESQVRVIESRPKPQCWDHGCNGREFSTFSNLLRHQRERSGAAAKSECPHCGAVFTRTTARNTHIAQGKCKGGGSQMNE